jgi:hypothetical protein
MMPHLIEGPSANLRCSSGVLWAWRPTLGAKGGLRQTGNDESSLSRLPLQKSRSLRIPGEIWGCVTLVMLFTIINMVSPRAQQSTLCRCKPRPPPRPGHIGPHGAQ